MVDTVVQTRDYAEYVTIRKNIKYFTIERNIWLNYPKPKCSEFFLSQKTNFLRLYA